MKPEEKAKELVGKYEYVLSYGCTHNAKKCALICVDELIKNNEDELDFVGVNYWTKVKQEIEKL